MHDMNIILLAGYAGSGKTTAATILLKHVPKGKCTAFAKQVKDDVAAKYNIDRELLDTQEGKATFYNELITYRDLLIEYSAKVKENTQNPGIWAEKVKEEILKEPSVQTWILHDWRYLAELDVLSKIPGAVIHTIRLIRDNKSSNSPSEHELDRTPVDRMIWNIGTIDSLDGALQHFMHTNHTFVYP